MPEERRQDPANTQMFRAFVERNEPEPARRNTALLVGVAVAVVIAAIVLIVVVLAA